MPALIWAHTTQRAFRIMEPLRDENKVLWAEDGTNPLFAEPGCCSAGALGCVNRELLSPTQPSRLPLPLHIACTCPRITHALLPPAFSGHAQPSISPKDPYHGLGWLPESPSRVDPLGLPCVTSHSFLRDQAKPEILGRKTRLSCSYGKILELSCEIQSQNKRSGLCGATTFPRKARCSCGCAFICEGSKRARASVLCHGLC